MEIQWHKKLFLYGNYLSYILFIAAFFGVIYISPYHLETLTIALKYYVCIFLLVRFNPFIKITSRDAEFDRKVAFSAGVFLLLTTTATSMAKEYISRNTIINHVLPSSDE